VSAATFAALAALALFRPPSGAGTHATRNVELRCLAPEQAAELARPHLPPAVTVVIRPDVRLPILRISGTHRDLSTAALVITELDARWGAERSAYCGGAAAGREAGEADAPGTTRAPERVRYQ
jgi:hypothetical protein